MTPTTNLRDQCLNHFATLGIPLRSESLDLLLTKAEKENLSHLDFLHQLIGEQANDRRERSVQRRIREAHFAEDKSLEGFNWKFNPKVLRSIPSILAIWRREVPPYDNRMTSLRVPSFMRAPVRGSGPGSTWLPIQHLATTFGNETTRWLDLRA